MQLEVLRMWTGPQRDDPSCARALSALQLQSICYSDASSGTLVPAAAVAAASVFSPTGLHPVHPQAHPPSLPVGLAAGKHPLPEDQACNASSVSPNRCMTPECSHGVPASLVRDYHTLACL